MRRLACTRCAPLVLRFGRARRGSRSGARISLTPRRHQLREALRLDELPPDSPEARFCTDACLCRYLRARAWDVAKATKLLHGSLQWRASVAIDALCFKDVAPEAVTGKMFRLPGVDKKGRPVLLMSPGKENTRDAAGQAEQAMYNIDMLLKEAGSQLDHICKLTIYIIDPRYREAVYTVVGRWLKGVYPVSTGIVITALARPEYLVEIDAMAVIPD